jgi:hypothetical protein
MLSDGHVNLYEIRPHCLGSLSSIQQSCTVFVMKSGHATSSLIVNILIFCNTNVTYVSLINK